MGIDGLFHLVNSMRIEKVTTLRELLRHKRLGVDASVWIHQLAVQYAREYVVYEQREQIVDAFYKRICSLKMEDVETVIVFDNIRRMPAKSRINARRETSRKKARATIDAAIANDDVGSLPASVLNAAISISEELTRDIIIMLHEQGIKFIISPFEADHQLTHLATQQHIDAIVSVDSDIIVHGCTLLIRKIEFGTEGLSCSYINCSDLYSTNVQTSAHDTSLLTALRSGQSQDDGFVAIAEDANDVDIFRILCKRYGRAALLMYAATAGCDYGKIKGVGTVTALAVLRAVHNQQKTLGILHVATELSSRLTRNKTTKTITEDATLSPEVLYIRLEDAIIAFELGFVFHCVESLYSPLSASHASECGGVTALIGKLDPYLCIASAAESIQKAMSVSANSEMPNKHGPGIVDEKHASCGNSTSSETSDHSAVGVSTQSSPRQSSSKLETEDVSMCGDADAKQEDEVVAMDITSDSTAQVPEEGTQGVSSAAASASILVLDSDDESEEWQEPATVRCLRFAMGFLHPITATPWVSTEIRRDFESGGGDVFTITEEMIPGATWPAKALEKCTVEEITRVLDREGLDYDSGASLDALKAILNSHGLTVPKDLAECKKAELKAWLSTRSGYAASGLSSKPVNELRKIAGKVLDLEKNGEKMLRDPYGIGILSRLVARGKLNRISYPQYDDALVPPGLARHLSPIQESDVWDGHIAGEAEAAQQSGWITHYDELCKAVPFVSAETIEQRFHYKGANQAGHRGWRVKVMRQGAQRAASCLHMNSLWYRQPQNEKGRPLHWLRIAVFASMNNHWYEVTMAFKATRCGNGKEAYTAMETIEKATCACPAGRSGYCVHVATLLWVIHLLPRPESANMPLPATSIPCRWYAPTRGPAVSGTTPLRLIPKIQFKMRQSKRPMHSVRRGDGARATVYSALDHDKFTQNAAPQALCKIGFPDRPYTVFNGSHPKLLPLFNRLHQLANAVSPMGVSAGAAQWLSSDIPRTPGTRTPRYSGARDRKPRLKDFLPDSPGHAVGPAPSTTATSSKNAGSQSIGGSSTKQKRAVKRRLSMIASPN